MESQGTPGQIQVTRATYELLKDEFELERRGTVPIKGKGDVETWYLVGPSRSSPNGPHGQAHGRDAGDPILT
jgi:class 3 adenylate cyclase